MSTPTPRTNDIAGCLIDSEEVVPADFARTLEIELARIRAQEGDYIKIIAEVLKCEPRPACEQPDNQLEAPWEVVARLRAEVEKWQKVAAQQSTRL
jgi:hypothetical protein